MIRKSKIFSMLTGILVVVTGFFAPIAAGMPSLDSSCCARAVSCGCCSVDNGVKKCGCKVDELPEFPYLPEGLPQVDNIKTDNLFILDENICENHVFEPIRIDLKTTKHTFNSLSPPLFLLNSSFII